MFPTWRLRLREARVAAHQAMPLKTDHPGHVVYGGDARWLHAAQSYYHDIRPTSELGISRIWVNRQGESDDPTLADAMITGLAELPEAVREVSQAR